MAVGAVAVAPEEVLAGGIALGAQLRGDLPDGPVPGGVVADQGGDEHQGRSGGIVVRHPPGDLLVGLFPLRLVLPLAAQVVLLRQGVVLVVLAQGEDHRVGDKAAEVPLGVGARLREVAQPVPGLVHGDLGGVVEIAGVGEDGDAALACEMALRPQQAAALPGVGPPGVVVGGVVGAGVGAAHIVHRLHTGAAGDAVPVELQPQLLPLRGRQEGPVGGEAVEDVTAGAVQLLEEHHRVGHVRLQVVRQGQGEPQVVLPPVHRHPGQPAVHHQAQAAGAPDHPGGEGAAEGGAGEGHLGKGAGPVEVGAVGLEVNPAGIADETVVIADAVHGRCTSFTQTRPRTAGRSAPSPPRGAGGSAGCPRRCTPRPAPGPGCGSAAAPGPGQRA